MTTYDRAIEMAQDDEGGACHVWLAPKVELLVSDYGETFTVWDYRPEARQAERRTSPVKAYRILRAVRGARLVAYSA